MIKWIRTRRLSIKKSLSAGRVARAEEEAVVYVDGELCGDTVTDGDEVMHCTPQKSLVPHLLNITVDVAGQAVSARLPVKAIAETGPWPFGGETKDTEEYKIAVAAIMDATGFNESFFSKNADVMLSPKASDPAWLLEHLGGDPEVNPPLAEGDEPCTLNPES